MSGELGNGRGEAVVEPLLCEVYPDLCWELTRLLEADELPSLAAAVRDLRIVAPCGCGDDFCQSFYTGPKPDGAYGPGHRNVPLFPPVGMLVLDVVDDRILFVEVLNLPPLRDQRAADGEADGEAAPDRLG